MACKSILQENSFKENCVKMMKIEIHFKLKGYQGAFFRMMDDLSNSSVSFIAFKVE